MFYSASTGCFYSREIHGDNIPPDAVEITSQLHSELLNGQSLGMVIVAGPDGIPVLEEAPPQPTPVPERVTMRQARLALLGAGLLDDVEQAIAAMGDTAEGRAARIEWDYSSEVFRNKPFVVQLGAALNLTDAQIDGLFITAAGID